VSGADDQVLSLWDDNPSAIDLLGFQTVAAPILAALNAPDLDPVTIGVHGPWGSGKSTVLKLIDLTLREDSRYILVSTNPWEYEDHDDVKGTLIAAVLDALEERASGDQPWATQARERVVQLARRVSWARVGTAVAKGAVTMAWNPSELLDAFALKPEEPRSLVGFREEFAKLVGGLEGVDRVVVLVDDLDRCLPTAVVQSLEAMKLFLSVKRMVFVIAADQELVRDSIAAYLPPSNRTERIAQNYLGKLIQIPVSLPRLPAHDAEAYVGLLLASLEGDGEEITALAEHCNERRAAGEAPLLANFGDLTFTPSAATLRHAAQVAQGLGSDRIGNPREIKRFLNAYGIRRTIAEARGIALAPQVISKLMILEDRYREAFEALAALDGQEQANFIGKWEKWANGDPKAKPPKAGLEPTRTWAASEPSLADEELGPYLTLAAALVASHIDIPISDDLLLLVRRMTGAGEADRNRAISDAVKKTIDDRRRIGLVLRERLRHADDITLHVDALVELAKATPELAVEVATWLSEVDHGLITPAIGVSMALSEVEEITSLGRALAEDDRVSEGARTALKEALP
jgi:hypothetical protein